MKPPPPTPYYATKIKLGLEKWSERILIFFEALLPNDCAQLHAQLHRGVLLQILYILKNFFNFQPLKLYKNELLIWQVKS